MCIAASSNYQTLEEECNNNNNSSCIKRIAGHIKFKFIRVSRKRGGGFYFDLARYIGSLPNAMANLHAPFAAHHAEKEKKGI